MANVQRAIFVLIATVCVGAGAYAFDHKSVAKTIAGTGESFSLEINQAAYLATPKSRLAFGTQYFILDPKNKAFTVVVNETSVVVHPGSGIDLKSAALNPSAASVKDRTVCFLEVLGLEMPAGRPPTALFRFSCP